MENLLRRSWPMPTKLFSDILGPPRFPAHPLLMARFGLSAIRSAYGLATTRFRTKRRGPCLPALPRTRSFRSIAPRHPPYGLVLILAAHATGWPVARGGSQHLAEALASYFRSLGGEIETAAPLTNVDDLPEASAVICDLTPRQLLKIARHRLPDGVLPPARAISLRTGRVQDRLGARRPDPLDVAPRVRGPARSTSAGRSKS